MSIHIHAKKRTAIDAGLDPTSVNSTTKTEADNTDTAAALQTGVLDKYDEIPKETTEEEQKRLAKREYQKKKLKKQRQSKKGFDIVAENTDLVQLIQLNNNNVDLTHHLGIQSSKSNQDLKQVKKKSRLQHTLMKSNEDSDVLVTLAPEITIQTKLENQLKLETQLKQLKQLQASIPTSKSSKKDKKLKKVSPIEPTLTKRQQRIDEKKTQKKSGKSMVQDELSNQLLLLSKIADKQETWSSTRITKENDKLQFFAEKEAKKIEKKEKEQKIKELMLEQVRIKIAEEKRSKKEFAE